MIKFKMLLVFVGLLFLSACSPRTYDVSDEFVLPEGLKGCTLYKMTNGNAVTMRVVHCPNSTTSTRVSGKDPKTAFVIDGY